MKKQVFLRTLPMNSDTLVGVRELHGYTPWYFNIPEEKHTSAWKYLLTTTGFKSAFWTNHSRADQSWIQSGLRGTRMPMEWTKLAVRNFCNPEIHGQPATQLQSNGCFEIGLCPTA